MSVLTNELLAMVDDGELVAPTMRQRRRLIRQIARVYHISPWVVGIGIDGVGMRPSRVANAAYRQRQRNRVKRRRR